MRIKIYIFIIAAVLLNVSHVFCASSITDNVITAGLDNMYLVHAFWDEQFCNSMLKDIKSNNYSIVEPIVRADYYQDPSLKVYTDKCPGMSLNKNIFFDPKFYDFAMTLPEEEFGTVTYYTKDFRIYHVDLDDNQENGKEFIFYAGGELRYSTTKFEVVDFSLCKEKASFYNGRSFDENSKEGVINYNDKFCHERGFAVAMIASISLTAFSRRAGISLSGMLPGAGFCALGC